jgi:hypothetical protein
MPRPPFRCGPFRRSFRRPPISKRVTAPSVSPPPRHLTARLASQLPGGERVPFMFTVKQLEAKSTSPTGVAPGTEFGGSFTVPSYRSGLFLDPKARPPAKLPAGFCHLLMMPVAVGFLDVLCAALV